MVVVRETNGPLSGSAEAFWTLRFGEDGKVGDLERDNGPCYIQNDNDAIEIVVGALLAMIERPLPGDSRG